MPPYIGMLCNILSSWEFSICYEIKIVHDELLEEKSHCRIFVYVSVYVNTHTYIIFIYIYHLSIYICHLSIYLSYLLSGWKSRRIHTTHTKLLSLFTYENWVCGKIKRILVLNLQLTISFEFSKQVCIIPVVY